MSDLISAKEAEALFGLREDNNMLKNKNAALSNTISRLMDNNDMLRKENEVYSNTNKILTDESEL